MLEQLSKLGFLFDVESLVSTHGNEAGMLEDMAGAVNELRNVRFVLVDEQEEIGEMDEESNGNKSPRSVSYLKLRSGKVKLTKALRHGGPIKVCPVLFTQGINEKQTLANNTGSSVTRLQDVINANSLKTLRSYCDRYCNYTSLRQLDKLIGTAGRQARKKRPEILQLSSDLCRSISGGRVTVCKSAKDRTGMSVTLEQGRILVQHHGLREQKKAGIVSVMRSEGVRIENALKNTGRRVFAFNALQRSLLPEEYRCPPQTSGRNVS
eukprot:jgi/Phyca11/548637/estExt2_Genewise1Plus.C_PHYCAscaffold_290317